MYSGIILHQGKVSELSVNAEGGMRLRLEAPTIIDRLAEGSSVNVSGVCLTAFDLDATGFFVDIMPQTLKLTTCGDWDVGEVLNLEPSLRVGDELGGHFVYGHIDGYAEIVAMEKKGNAVVAQLKLPPELIKFVVPQGSVTLDGVSLTVVEVNGELFSVSLIPETIERTTWTSRQPGDFVNFEADMMIKYLWQVSH